MLAHVILLNTLGRYSIEWVLMTRKSLHCLEHIHLEEQGLTGVAGESQKQNILRMGLVNPEGNHGQLNG